MHFSPEHFFLTFFALFGGIFSFFTLPHKSRYKSKNCVVWLCWSSAWRGSIKMEPLWELYSPCRAFGNCILRGVTIGTVVDSLEARMWTFGDLAILPLLLENYFDEINKKQEEEEENQGTWLPEQSCRSRMSNIRERGRFCCIALDNSYLTHFLSLLRFYLSDTFTLLIWELKKR